ncbi:polysaccharide pyruvyl transferase family protein [Rhizobium sullae]|uniref:polysaccharide pyruvyl transferase family protein n=1 Tax=Rhizobium sullae TaxID=50338 RepID=UPI00104BAD53|nr:polysaccharide pyruvyl transferase family protein [Rhizobium sullae]
MLYLIAGNGSPNFGDELIVQNWLRFYRENGYKGQITVDGKGNIRSERLIRGFGDVRFVTNIPRHSEGREGTYADFYKIGKDYAADALDRFKGVRAFHLLGGGYVSANWFNAARLLSAVTNLGEELSVPVVATGLGIAPFRNLDGEGAAAWSHIVAGCRLFECRDEESYRSLMALTDGKLPSLTFGLDDAFLSSLFIKRHAGRWLHLSGFSQASIIGKSEGSAPDLFKQFDKVVFWTCSTADAALHADLVQKYPVVERYNNERLLNEGLPIGADDFMITGRFHPHLQAARAGISGLFTADSGFYKTKHGLVTDLGSPFASMKEEPKIFQGNSTRMVSCEAGRVEEKQRVGRRVLALLDII